MNKEMFQEIILKEFKCDLSVFEKIEIYKNMIQKYNQKYNLTRLDSDDKIYLNYFFESIIVYKDLIENKDLKLLDIGSGSGIPGILIKLFFPKINVSIIESNNKKCDFINALINSLELEEINIICKRAEDIKDSERESFDYVTSRAVAPLKVLLEISTPYLKIGGIIIEPKSNNIDNELKEAQNIINNLSLENMGVISQKFFNRTHNIILFRKKIKTPLEFPREWKDIIK